MLKLNIISKKPSLQLRAVGAVFFMLIAAGCNNSASVKNIANTDSAKTDASKVVDADAIDFNAPVISYDEMKDTSINIQGNATYSIYSMHNNVLFDVGKSSIRKGAEEKLHEIAQSINKHFANGTIGVYGYADSTASASLNKNLAEDRANNVKNWLMAHENIPANRIEALSLGESNPIASNDTKKGRQQNRTVEIVVTKGKLHNQ